jgi:hypothetical protein
MRSSICNILCVDQHPKSDTVRFIVEVSRSLTIISFRSPLYGRSARRRSHYLNYTQQTGKTNIRVFCGIRSSDPSNQETAYLRLRFDGYLDRLTLYFSPMTQQSLVGQDLLTDENSRSHLDTPHLVESLWTGDQPVTETSTSQNATFSTDVH